MKQLLSLLICLGLVSSPALAQAPGKAHGQGPAGTVGNAEKKIADEAVNAVVDELVGNESAPKGTGMPPGLAKKGGMPPGLAKQGKTPPGWQKAKFGEPEKKEGLIRRFVHKLFREEKKEEEKNKD